jgi:hypothetical protein
MNSAEQAHYYAKRANEFNRPLVDDIIDVCALDPGDSRTRLALVDALTRAYRLGQRDGAIEVVAQLQESDLAVECTLDIEIASGPLGAFGD